MSSHDVVVAVYVLLGCCIVGLQLASHHTRRIPSFGELMSRVMTTRTRRVGVMVAWAWLGLHFFAR